MQPPAGKSKIEKSMSTSSGGIETSLESNCKPRSRSVPSSILTENPENDEMSSSSIKSALDLLQQEVNSDSDLYLEREFHREMTHEDVEQYSESPILREQETDLVFLGDEPLTEQDVLNDENNEPFEEDDIDDDLYPEIERLPRGYANMYFAEMENSTRG